VPLRTARSSARRTGGMREDEGETETEKPTTGEVGNEDLEVEAEPASPAGWRSNDANDLLRTGGAAAGAGADGDVGAGTGVGAVDADAAADTVESRGGVGTTVEGSGTSAEGAS
jgi:hypothetical protein